MLIPLISATYLLATRRLYVRATGSGSYDRGLVTSRSGTRAAYERSWSWRKVPPSLRWTYIRMRSTWRCSGKGDSSVAWQTSNDPAAVRRWVMELQRSTAGDLRLCDKAKASPTHHRRRGQGHAPPSSGPPCNLKRHQCPNCRMPSTSRSPPLPPTAVAEEGTPLRGPAQSTSEDTAQAWTMARRRGERLGRPVWCARRGRTPNLELKRLLLYH